jgi:hypothetical protein
MQEAIIETLKEMDPEFTLIFMEKLNLKVRSLQHDSPEYNQYLLEVSHDRDI